MSDKKLNGNIITGNTQLSGNVDCKHISISGSLQTGTRDYNKLINKPRINGVTLEGDKSLHELGIQPEGNYALESDIPTRTSQLTNDSGFINRNVDNLTNYYTKTQTNCLLNDKQDILTEVNAGTGIEITTDASGNVVINSTRNSAIWGNIDGTITDQTDLITYINEHSSGAIDTISVNNVQQPIVDKNVNINVPTATSQLSNDSNYVVDADYVHTDNNYTTSEKTKLSGIDSGAQENIIEQVKVNSTPVQIVDKSVNIVVPTDNSQLTNGAGYITGYTETDPTVPAWAKQPTKPTYTASEVGALPSTTFIPSNTSDLTNDSNFVSDANYVHTDTNYTAADRQKVSALGIWAGAHDIGGPANRAMAIPFGAVDSTSTATDITATVTGLISSTDSGDVQHPYTTDNLADGTCCYIKNGVITSASGWTLNVNGLGGKPVYQTLAAAGRITTTFNINYTMLFVWNSSRVDGGCWDLFYGFNSDNNTTAYMVRQNQTNLLMYSALTRYKICFTRHDGKLLPTTAVSNSTGTTKALTTESFDPFGMIWYYSTTTGVAADASPSASYMWTMHYTVDLRYSFNSGSTLTAKEPVYVKCSPQTDGSFKLSGNNCIVQSLPNTADGYAYIFLGRAYDTYRITFEMMHPIYYYADGALRLWTNRKAIGSGLPAGGTQGQILVKNSNTDGDASWVSPANVVEQDNTLPITSAAVYTEVGNINALLATI